jgi:hypothetical protein
MINNEKHMRLLNYLLNEASQSERVQLEKELKTDIELQREMFVLKSAIELTKQALVQEPLPRLSKNTIKRLQDEMQTVPVSWFKRTGPVAAFAAASLVLLITVVFREAKINQSPTTEEQVAQAPAISGDEPTDSVTDSFAATEEVSPKAADTQMAIKGTSSVALLSGVESDFGDISKIELLDEPAFQAVGAGEHINGYPKRIALLATGVTNQNNLASMTAKEEKIRDCFKDGFSDQAFLHLRLYAGSQNHVTKVEVIRARKMPLADRLCIIELVENTSIFGFSEGQSLTLFIRPMNDFK